MPEAPTGPPPDEPAGPVGGRELARSALLSDRPLEAKLAVVAQGDPLGLYPLGARRVRARWLYLDPGRVFEESVFTVTALSRGLRPQDDLDAWLTGRVDDAINHLLRRDAEALLDGSAAEQVRESSEYLSGCWGLPAADAFRAAVRFNGLTERSRRTFFALLVEHKSAAECLAEGLGPMDALKRHAQQAVAAILGPRGGGAAP